MNKIVFAVVVACASSCFAEPKMPRGAARLALEQKAAAEAKEVAESGTPRRPRLPRGGGIVRRRLPGGVFVFADARTDRKGGDFSAIVNDIEINCRVPCDWRKMSMGEEKCPVRFARSLVSSKMAAAVAVVYNGKSDDPVLTVMPENGIATLNVTPLYEGVDDKVGDGRLEKELWRTICFAIGGTDSGIDECVMHTIVKPSDLDKIECRMASPFSTGGVADSASRYGLGKVEAVMYKIACREGWAPAPTNEQQQAYWDKAQRLRKLELQDVEPTDPIKIKFDPKKNK